MRRSLIVALLIAVVVSTHAQELGRGSLTVEGGRRAGLGRAALPPAQSNGFRFGGTHGFELGLGLASVDWDIGPASGSQAVFAPQATWFYKTTDNVDLNISALFVSAEDEDEPFGDNEADLTRIGVGVRYWIDRGSRLVPYVGIGLGYYLTDCSTVRTLDSQGQIVDADVGDVDDVPGVFLEGGAAYEIADNFYITGEIAYDLLLGDAEVSINGSDEDFDISALSLNLGVAWMF